MLAQWKERWKNRASERSGTRAVAGMETVGRNDSFLRVLAAT